VVKSALRSTGQPAAELKHFNFRLRLLRNGSLCMCLQGVWGGGRGSRLGRAGDGERMTCNLLGSERPVGRKADESSLTFKAALHTGSLCPCIPTAGGLGGGVVNV